MELTPTNFVAPLTLSTVVLFGCLAYAIFVNSSKNGSLVHTTEFFLTAKNTQPWYRVAWGFYACSLGASVIFSVPSFVADPVYGGGWLGLVSYSIFSGLPLFIIAIMGLRIKKRFPKVMSIGSFTNWRFGKAFQTWVTINVLINLSCALVVEYTAIGSLAVDFLGIPAYIPIIVVGSVTMLYTMAGGLYISLITDSFQSIFIFLLLAIVGIFVAINFRVDALGPLPDYLGLNQVGYSSIITLGVGITSSAMFSDAIWQRVWSAKDDRALLVGAGVGSILVTLVTFLFGFGGFIAAWAGLVKSPNTAFFELLNIGRTADGTAIIPIGMLAILLLVASVMNEAAIDSYQIAIGDTIASLFDSFDVKLSITSIRVILVAVNVPFAFIGCFGFKIIGLFLITNLMTTCLVKFN